MLLLPAKLSATLFTIIVSRNHKYPGLLQSIRMRWRFSRNCIIGLGPYLLGLNSTWFLGLFFRLSGFQAESSWMCKCGPLNGQGELNENDLLISQTCHFINYDMESDIYVLCGWQEKFKGARWWNEMAYQEVSYLPLASRSPFFFLAQILW